MTHPIKPNPEPMHPDDIAAERESIEYAKAAIDRWFEKNRKKLIATISTYPDGDAEDAWWSLREDFWATNQTAWRRKNGTTP